MKIKWSKESKINYNEIIGYLFNFWTKKEIQNFNINISKIKENIKLNPYMYPSLEGYLNIKKAKISKQISIIFSIKKDFIYLITFWNHYRNPETSENILEPFK